MRYTIKRGPPKGTPKCGRNGVDPGPPLALTGRLLTRTAAAILLLLSIAGPAQAQISDEFNGPAGSLNTNNKWQQAHGGGWYDGCMLPELANVDGQGHLRLRALRQPNSCGLTYASGGVVASPTIKFGRVEYRAKVACGSGTWDALWMNSWEVGWPASGEIDVLDQMADYFNGPTNERDVKIGIHGVNAQGQHWHPGAFTYRRTAGWFSQPRPLCWDFHTYAVDWRPGSLTFMFDGRVIKVYNRSNTAGLVWPFDTYGQHVIMSLQVGGGWGGYIDPNAFPATMLVDWVRVT